MKISEFYQKSDPVFSIEIFPPKTPEGVEKLKEKLHSYKKYSPDFISVTYGAGGSTRENTHSMASYIKNELSIEAVAHLTCVAHTKQQVHEVLQKLTEANIENVMALRGDFPKDFSRENHQDAFQYASELIRFLKKNEPFGIGAAGYPEGHVESVNWEQDQLHLLKKIDAGAEVIISQFFLNNDFFLRWRDFLIKKGVTIPIVAGILPAQSYEQIQRFAQSCGCQLPEKLMSQLEQQSDSADAMRQIGIEHAYDQMEALLKEGVAGIHLYALNRLENVEHLAPLCARTHG